MFGVGFRLRLSNSVKQTALSWKRKEKEKTESIRLKASKLPPEGLMSGTVPLGRMRWTPNPHVGISAALFLISNLKK